MNCVKLLGQRLMSRQFDRQVAEVQIRVAVLNRFTALGIPMTVAAGGVCPGKGGLRSPADLSNSAGRVPHGSILSDIFYRGWVSSQ